MSELSHIMAVWFNWTTALQIVVMTASALIVYQTQLNIRYEQLTGQNHGFWGGMRRLSLICLGGSMTWAIYYGWELGWSPWPPFAVAFAIFDINIFARIKIMHQDIKRLEARMGGGGRIGFMRERDAYVRGGGRKLQLAQTAMMKEFGPDDRS